MSGVCKYQGHEYIFWRNRILAQIQDKVVVPVYEFSFFDQPPYPVADDWLPGWLEIDSILEEVGLKEITPAFRLEPEDSDLNRYRVTLLNSGSESVYSLELDTLEDKSHVYVDEHFDTEPFKNSGLWFVRTGPKDPYEDWEIPEL